MLSVPMEAISEAALRLFDRWLTDAMGTRPDAHRSRGGRTRTTDAPNKDACKGKRVSKLSHTPPRQTKAFLALRDACLPEVTSNGEVEGPHDHVG